MRSYVHAAGLVLALTPSLALAHAGLEIAEASQNSSYKAIIKIGHGCEGTATHTVRVDVPEGVIAAKPMPKAGWTLDVVRGAYAKSYDYYGTPMTEGVQEIVWSGGELPDAFYDEFVFRAKVTDLPVGTAIPVPVVQECGPDVSERWIEVPEAGKVADDYEFPAPTLTIIQGE